MAMRAKCEAEYQYLIVTDTLVVIADRNQGARSVTNDAHAVVAQVHEEVGGLGNRSLYYADSTGRYDQLSHDGAGRFKGFVACTSAQQGFLRQAVSKIAGEGGAL